MSYSVNDMTLTRRSLLAALPLVALAPAAQAVVSSAQAQQIVTALSDEIIRIVNSGTSESAAIREFERIFERYADVPTIARFSLGVAARDASRGQLSAFSDAFSGYVARKYGVRFKEFEGGSIEIGRTRQDRQVTIVEATARLPGESPIAVEFHLSDRGGSAKVFNLVLEGVNMLTTERAEITAMLDQEGGSIDALTRRLRG